MTSAEHRPTRDASPARGLLHHSTGERCVVCELPWPCRTARELAGAVSLQEEA